MTAATSNNLESTNIHSADGCLVLDELKQLPSAEVAVQAAYSILTGQGRSRNHAGFNLLGDASIGKSMMLAATSQTAPSALN